MGLGLGVLLGHRGRRARLRAQALLEVLRGRLLAAGRVLELELEVAQQPHELGEECRELRRALALRRGALVRVRVTVRVRVRVRVRLRLRLRVSVGLTLTLTLTLTRGARTSRSGGATPHSSSRS